MAYRRKEYVNGSTKKIENPEFSEEVEEFIFTSLPIASTSWILESINFREIINSTLLWDPEQSGVSPGDALKAMVLALSMGPERPALENISDRYEHEPMKLYFESIENREQMDPDMFARTLTKFHEAGTTKIFLTVSAAIRTFFGIKTRALHSDTTSVSVYGEYDVYNSDGAAEVIKSDGTRDWEEGALYITRGYSKDKRPDLKQYMLGDAVDDNGLPWVSKVLDGNTADPDWNKECLEILKDTLINESLIYVADSKVVNDPLVSMMINDGIMFLSRCPANFNDLLLDRTLMSFDLDKLNPIPNFSPRKKAAKRRITGTSFEYMGKKLRAVLVETSTLAGKGEKAIKNAESDFKKAVDVFERDYSCKPDAEKAFARFLRKHSKSIFDISAEYEHSVVEKRPKGRPRADGSDIRRYDVWTVKISYALNAEKAEILRRRKSYMMLISNVPQPSEGNIAGMDDETLTRLYSEEWRVEWGFRGKKRPVMVERLFMKDVGRSEALITVVNIAALVRATLQLLLRRGVDELSDEELPRIGKRGARLQRNVTSDFFIGECGRCFIRYDPRLNRCRFFNNYDDRKAASFLSLMGIPKDRIFTGGV